MSYLSADEFRQAVRTVPLVALDLVLVNDRDEVLLGRRVNSPARGYWFVPGGRIKKDERFQQAVPRILREETGCREADVCEVRVLGVYEHIYPDNAFGESGYGTHYVVAAYWMRLLDSFRLAADPQHEEFRFFSAQELLADPLVHAWVKSYFLEKPGNMLGEASLGRNA